jgi:proline dehydrogenase
VQEVNVMLQSINTLIGDSNESVVEQTDTMISENAAWVDGELSNKMNSAAANANKQGVSANLDRLEKLIEKSHMAEEDAAAILKRVGSVTKNILESGEDISRRRDSIQADRERVIANQRRTADMIIKA